MIGRRLGSYEISSKLGEGGPPPRRSIHAALRRGLAVAQREPRP